MMSSIDGKHLFLFLIFGGWGARLILCRYLSMSPVGGLSEVSHMSPVHLLLLGFRAVLWESSFTFPLETSLSGEALAGISLLSQCVLFCHVGPLRFYSGKDLET